MLFAFFGGSVVVVFSFALVRYRRYLGVAAEEDESPAKNRANRLFRIINAAQWVAILIVGNVLANIHLSARAIPATIFIIGLYFLPLAAILSNPAHSVTVAHIILRAVRYPLFGPLGPNNAIGPLAAGIILWASVF